MGTEGEPLAGPAGPGPTPPPLEPPRPTAPALLDARSALWLLVVYLGTQTAVAFGIASVYVAIHVAAGDGSDPESLERVVARLQGPIGVVAAAGAGAAVLAALLRRIGRSGGAAIGRQVGLALGSRRALALGLLAGAALVLVYFPVVTGLLFPPEPDRTPGPVSQMALSPGWQRWLWTSMALLVAPPVEELLFRGALQAGFARSWGWRPAALVTTALFVSLHYSEFRTYLPAAGALVGLSMLTLWLRRRSGALGPAVAAHAGYNLGVFGLVHLGLLLQGRG